MRNTLLSSVSRLSLAVAVTLVMTMSGRFNVLAQGRVEQAETTWEVKRPVDSSIRASEAAQKPNGKPRPEQTGHLAGDYVWSSAMELGYRFVDTDGSRDKFLSDLYLRPGLRLLDLQMDARSISGSGKL